MKQKNLNKLKELKGEVEKQIVIKRNGKRHQLVQTENAAQIWKKDKSKQKKFYFVATLLLIPCIFFSFGALNEFYYVFDI